MLYQKPSMEILELSTKDVVCTSDKIYDPNNPDGNVEDMGNEIW